MYVLLIFHEVRPISKTRNQFHWRSPLYSTSQTHNDSTRLDVACTDFVVIVVAVVSSW